MLDAGLFECRAASREASAQVEAHGTGLCVQQHLVVATIARLREHGFESVRELITAEEHVVFPLPRELRS